MRTVVGYALVSFVVACASGDPRESSVALSGNASLDLSNATGTLAQTSARTWSLAKTGAVTTSSQKVTWTITATETTNTANQLALSGCVSLKNSGASGATLGNIIANLQTRANNTWVTQSTDVANATAGDAATSAAIAPHASSEGRSSFATNGASGKLEFTSPCGGAAFSLSPEDTIAGGATLSLGYTATFDNNALALAAGTPVRVEIIVSSGNAPPSGPSAANVDINGNGVIDADEAWVRSVPARIGTTVPAATTVTATPTITDTAANISTTGSVTFSNAAFSIGATTGTVTASYDGGTQGGTIKNCATLTGQGLVGVTACDTETIPRTPWKNGQVVTYGAGDWGNGGNATALLLAGFDIVYAGTSGVLTVGGSFTMKFTSPLTVNAYLPAIGTPAALNQNLVDPLTSSSGAFGGDVTALQLDVDFSDAGLLVGTANVSFGDLSVCNLASTTDLNGKSVRQVLAIVNTALGGGSTIDSVASLDGVASALSLAFDGGTPSAFAQQSLFVGPCE